MDFLDYIGFSSKDNNISNESMKAANTIDFSETSSPIWLLGLMYQPCLICSDEQGGSMLDSSMMMTSTASSSTGTGLENSSMSVSSLPNFADQPQQQLPTPNTINNTNSMMNQQQMYGQFQQQQQVSNNDENSPKTPSKPKRSFFSMPKKKKTFSDNDLVKIYHNKLQFESFLSDFESRFWLTYRKDFEPISSNPLPMEQIELQTVNSLGNLSSMNSSGIISSQGSALSSGASHNGDDTPFLTGSFTNSPPHAQYYFNNSNGGNQSTKSASSSSLSKLYRYVINYTAPTSDTGWGCMMRSGQMLLAQAFLTHYLGRNFRLPTTDRTRGMYQIIQSWFYDLDACPYSIHKIARAGTYFGKKVGEWFGPSTISYVLKLLVEQHLRGEFVVHVADQGGIYIDELLGKCEYDYEEFSIDVNNVQKENTESIYPQIECIGPRLRVTKKWRPLIILIPLRLGLENFNTDYIPSIKKVFEIPQTLGIMGGKPKSSLYFIGYHDNEVIYLDPHTTQKSSPKEETYHCKTPLKIPVSKIDPSMALGFLCSTRQDFDEFCNLANQYLTHRSHPLVCIREHKPQEKDLDVLSFDDMSDENNHKEHHDDEDDDIVFV
ncbi:hypothetical protein C9374_010946 [Naegleria lovaniensis]|uniref:Cysteine protease n=1 Tax=Naegleria lovaniensis TaxID=51637 RepID=A0AA88KFT6_NAELO|nr:uncharacterized protein C9374_010946 [Naegleria lovaniensis]KAG2374376.1 hypothetical protein C9374_010946 [Naegleria lovaniensis]